MLKRYAIVLTLGLLVCLAAHGDIWKIHSLDRPPVPIVTPPEKCGAPPGDAIVLFDGTDLSQWEHADGTPADWKVENGYMEAQKTGDIRTKKSYGDCQLHVEWSPPEGGTSQGAGNSGVFLMDQYEIQVLNSYGNVTYPDGQAGAVYAQYPPLVNVSRPAREWQTYDIIWRGPRFAADGTVKRKATVTVLQNGVLVQDHVPLTGPTNWQSREPYKKHPMKMPIHLQDHNNPVRYRNIWIRELGKNRSINDGPAEPIVEPTVTLTSAQLDAVTGKYGEEGQEEPLLTVRREGDKLVGTVRNQRDREFLASSPTRFFFQYVNTVFTVKMNDQGKVESADFSVGGDPHELKPMR